MPNSQFSPRPTRPICPTCPTCRTRPTIQNSQFPSHYLERIIGFKNVYLYGEERKIAGQIFFIVLISKLLKF
ncbi:hypothetical protein HMPREF1551_01845 [Capnocytophaga sp. oral taxon 863 str. F0517]|nr:hypothetical protein HMPREF1551_01845 [Capnocytophaga sp. oral taxon 863 str. F0517]